MFQNVNFPDTEIYMLLHRYDCSCNSTMMAILATGNHDPSTFTHASLSSIPKDDEVLIFMVDCFLFTDLLHLPWCGTYCPIPKQKTQCITK